MNETIINDNSYIGYEYKEVLIRGKDKISLYIDGYRNFGWNLDENRNKLNEKEKNIIYLKRDRMIINKVEITRLQRHFEDCLKQIDELERSKTAKARLVSVIICILGTIFITAATFATVNSPPIIWLSIILAIPGFVGWITPYFVYKNILKKRNEVIEPLINDKYEEIYTICEKGNRLLRNDDNLKKVERKKKMKVAIYNGKRNIIVKDLPKPKAGTNDIVVKNLYASICGTDVAVYQHGPGTGHKITVGGEFGHEVVSEVIEVGENVKDIKVGDRVYPYPRLAKGDPKRAGTIGGFSEYILIPNAKLNEQVYKVNEKISDKEASLIEPFTVGCRAARRAFPKKKEKAIVFGAGTIGIAAAIALKYFGCEKVMICDHSEFRLKKAKNLGFEVCNNGVENLQEKAIEYFGEALSIKGITADVDIYIDAAGAESILETYQRIGKIESRMVIVAVLAGMRPVDILDMTFSQHALIGSGGYMPEDVKDVMNIMESGMWDIESIITNEFTLDNISEAIEKASDVDNSLNVVIRY